ncbi:sensor histidine kinase [Methylobacterium oryzae]|uniref:sensor histidine kinase n=1 Tax=Methylobacterium oryzae TaxID=334852 RepID=UPI002F35D204
MTETQSRLRVGAHVLIQLGSELVTDVEQAILECVKNAYDADSEDCKIEILTREEGSLVEAGTFGRLGHLTQPAESVNITLSDPAGDPIDRDAVDLDDPVVRRLSYTGRISIIDHGVGLTREQLDTSWLVISQSIKRTASGTRKAVSKKTGRTPLGDKGLGRLGTMKLGDILLIETATSPTAPLAKAYFRWGDCTRATIIDDIPVVVKEEDNTERFQGTKVSVLGLSDMPEWRRKGRIDEITRSLARLISPFEAAATFPVTVKLDDDARSLVTVTKDIAAGAVAEFTFRWERDPTTDTGRLVAVAQFRKRLLASKRGDKNKRTERIFEGADEGAKFADALPGMKRMRGFKSKVSQTAPWYVEMTRIYPWTDFQLDNDASMLDPGPFRAAFHYFHLDEWPAAAAGNAISRGFIKGVAGIAILRDGFRVRSQGDWLGIAAGMTSGSTYGMRVDNTVGYFALTGAENFALTEKSDREGFVEDAAYRGFFQLATRCRDFANDAMEAVRRSLDEYAKKLDDEHPAAVSIDPLAAVERNLQTTEDARSLLGRRLGELQDGFEVLERAGASPADASSARTQAMKLAGDAIVAIEDARRTLEAAPPAELTLRRIQEKVEAGEEQAVALFESAAVGLSARGLAHELRTHLSEIRRRATAIQNVAKGDGTETAVMPHLRAIRGSCASISGAASQIDPMLPRSRAVRDTFKLADFVRDYIANRILTFEQEGVKVTVSPRAPRLTVRANRARLLQVLDNIVRNSLYWLRVGEKAKLNTGPKSIDIELTDFGIVVSDTGPGVKQDLEDAIFEIFVSDKPDRDVGQGLGLFIITQLLALDACDVALLEDRNANGRRYRFAVNLAPISVNA